MIGQYWASISRVSVIVSLDSQALSFQPSLSVHILLFFVFLHSSLCSGFNSLCRVGRNVMQNNSEWGLCFLSVGWGPPLSSVITEP